MNAKERGFLLLTSALGNPERKPLSVAQFRTLASRVAQMEKPEISRDLRWEDLIELGYDRNTAVRIMGLMEEEEALERYLYRGKQMDCIPITRVSDHYPLAVRQRLG